MVHQFETRVYGQEWEDNLQTSARRNIASQKKIFFGC